MTNLEIKNQSPDGLVSELELGDFKASWVGEYPLGNGVAFGGEDGRILLVNQDGTISGHAKADTNEAINGLAFLPGWMGISTRNEVQFVDVPRGECVPVPYGAHGVVVGPDEQFVSPLGTVGLLFFKPAKEEKLPVTIRRPRNATLNSYRAILLKGPNGQNVVATATRKDGIAAMPFDSSNRGIHTLTYETFDAIDLCSLAPSSFAVAVLGKDGAIMMCRDVIEETLKKQASVTTRFADIRGTAYRILNAKGTLVVLTSQAIFFLGDMATNFLLRKPGPVTILEFPIKAIDANIVNEHWLMIVTSRGVLKMDLRKLNWGEERENGFSHRLRQQANFLPAWQGREVEQLVGV